MKFCPVLCSYRQGWLCSNSEHGLLFLSVPHQDDLHSPHFFKHSCHKYLCNTPKVHLFQTAPLFQTFLISIPNSSLTHGSQGFSLYFLGLCCLLSSEATSMLGICYHTASLPGKAPIFSQCGCSNYRRIQIR